MIRITYRARRFIDRYSCVDTLHTFVTGSMPEPAPGTSQYYFKNDRFNYKVIGADDIVSVEEIEKR